MPRKSLEASLFAVQVASGMKSGVNFNQAFLWNVGTCRFNVKGEAQAEDLCKSESTEVKHRGGMGS